MNDIEKLYEVIWSYMKLYEISELRVFVFCKRPSLNCCKFSNNIQTVLFLKMCDFRQYSLKKCCFI